MRSFITVFALTLMITSAFGQSYNLSIGIAEGKNFYSYGLEYIESDISQKAHVNHDIGLYASYHRNERWAVDVSVFYSSKDYELLVDADNYQWVDPNDPLRTSGKQELEYKLRYLDILVALKRNVWVRNLTRIYLSLGARPGFKLQENDRFHNFSPNLLRAQNLLVSGNIGLGIKQGFSQRSGVFLEPNFAYYLNQIYKGYEGRNTMAFRIMTGVYFTL